MAKKKIQNKRSPPAGKARKKPPARGRVKSYAAGASSGDGTDSNALLGIRVAFLIHDVSRMRRSAYDEIMKPLGITRAQWWILAHLSRHDGMMQTQLADLLDVGKASVGILLERLETSGFIERRADPTDKRARRVFMQRAAHQMLKRLTAEEAKFNDFVLRELSVAEREELLRLLGTIKKVLAEFHAPGPDPTVKQLEEPLG